MKIYFMVSPFIHQEMVFPHLNIGRVYFYSNEFNTF
jgi:hypothetical protein